MWRVLWIQTHLTRLLSIYLLSCQVSNLLNSTRISFFPPILNIREDSLFARNGATELLSFNGAILFITLSSQIEILKQLSSKKLAILSRNCYFFSQSKHFLQFFSFRRHFSWYNYFGRQNLPNQFSRNFNRETSAFLFCKHSWDFNELPETRKLIFNSPQANFI